MPLVTSPVIALPVTLLIRADELCAGQHMAPRHCQTNLNGPAKGAGLRRSGHELPPLGQGVRTVLFEDVAAVVVTVVVEVVVD